MVELKPSDKVFKSRSICVSAFCEATVQEPPFVAIIGALDSTLNNDPESESLVAGIGAGFWMVAISLAMLISGAILKAIARSSREDS